MLKVNKSLFIMYMRSAFLGCCVTVETRIKEPKFVLGSLNRYLIKWLLFKLPASKVLRKALIYSTHLADINAVFSIRILKNSFVFMRTVLGLNSCQKIMQCFVQWKNSD